MNEELKFEIREDPQVDFLIMKSAEGETSIEFFIHDKVVLGFYEDGSIYVQGRLAENDKAVVDGIRDFLKKNELYNP